MRKCPFCAEKIQNNAVVCQYCGREISAEAISPLENDNKKTDRKKLMLSLGIILGMLVMATSGYYLFRKIFSPNKTMLQNNQGLTISRIAKSAVVRSSNEEDFAQAQTGQVLPAGSEVLTSEPEGAQLDFNDGTIVRMGTNSYVTLLNLGSGSAASIHLFSGKVWVILKGQPLEVQTLAGTALVRGSYMSVSFDSLGQAMDVTCLEGNCTLKNNEGTTALATGQAATISGLDEAPSIARTMDAQQRVEWAQTNPEAQAIAGSIDTSQVPHPTTTPQFQLGGGAGSPEQYPNMRWFPYYFENNCRGGEGKLSRTPWHWEYEYYFDDGSQGVWYISFAIQPGEARSGFLPVGKYILIGDYTEEGSIRNWWGRTSSNIDFKIYDENSKITIALCPDDPPLPGRPADFQNP